jgi:peroxiredoxin
MWALTQAHCAVRDISRRSISSGQLDSRSIAMLKVGDQAPDFELLAQDGKPVALSSLRGRKVLLWFYPKADTPG